jgi:hypothetical protein
MEAMWLSVFTGLDWGNATVCVSPPVTAEQDRPKPIYGRLLFLFVSLSISNFLKGLRAFLDSSQYTRPQEFNAALAGTHVSIFLPDRGIAESMSTREGLISEISWTQLLLQVFETKSVDEIPQLVSHCNYGNFSNRSATRFR